MACAEGLSTTELATPFWLSEGTIPNRPSEILGKLGIRTRVEAIQIARDQWLAAPAAGRAVRVRPVPELAKFVTTREYAPRLRIRLEREMELIADAEARNWAREVERHRCIVQRIEKLLAEHGEPIFAGAPNVAADNWIRTPPLLESCIR